MTSNPAAAENFPELAEVLLRAAGWHFYRGDPELDVPEGWYKAGAVEDTHWVDWPGASLEQAWQYHTEQLALEQLKLAVRQRRIEALRGDP